MRKVFLLSFLLMLIVSVVSAQDGNTMKFKASEPFVVDNTTLPAGSYSIHRMSDDGTLELAAAAGQPQVLIEADPLETPAGKANLTFSKYGNKLVLKQIDFPDQMSFWVPMSTTEKHHRKAGGKPTKTTVTPTK
jgi:hypothetical protein